VGTGDSISSIPSIPAAAAAAAGRATEQADTDGAAVVVAPQGMTQAELLACVRAADKEKDEFDMALALIAAFEASEAEESEEGEGIRSAMAAAGAAGSTEDADSGESGHQQSLAAPVATGNSRPSIPSIAFRAAAAAGRATARTYEGAAADEVEILSVEHDFLNQEAGKPGAARRDLLQEGGNSASRSAVEEVAAVVAARSSQAEVATVDSRCFGKVYNMMTVLSTPNLLWNIS